MKRKVFVCAQFPPPVNGFSTASQFVYDRLKETDSFDVIKFSFVRITGDTISFYFNRILKSIYLPLLLLKNRRSAKESVFYLAVSGGSGMIFEIFSWTIAGWLCRKRIMHHHSFQYIHKKSRLMAIMQRWHKHKTYNVFLCDCHYKQFAKLYKIDAQNATVIGNEMIFSGHYYDDKKTAKKPDTDVIVGHLSNLSAEKGFDIFCRLVEKFHDRPGVKFELAGPANNYDIEQKIDELLFRYPGKLVYHGPLYKEQKINWYRHIDFFVFPSVYKNETFPLVVTEAMLFNAIPLTTDIACLKEFNRSEFIFPQNLFVDKAYDLILNSYTDPVAYSGLLLNLKQRKAEVILKGKKDLSALIALFEN